MNEISKRKCHNHKERSQGRRRKDLISKLPDDLLHKILLNLSTKDSIKTSILANRWRHLWKHVPGLEIDYIYETYHSLKDFVNKFLEFDKTSLIYQLKLCVRSNLYGNEEVSDLINSVITRGVRHLEVNTASYVYSRLSVSIYRCETLVHLKLNKVVMPSYELISLPRLETMHLNEVLFRSSDIALENLISSSKVLRVLNIQGVQNVKVLRVRSHTLKSLHIKVLDYNLISEVVIDAPRLKSLHLDNVKLTDIILKSLCSPSEMVVNLSTYGPIDLSKIETFWALISNVPKLGINYSILKAMYTNLRLEPLPLFLNLTHLRVSCDSYLSLTFLMTCPNLKSLDLLIDHSLHQLEIQISPTPKCLLTSLEFVKIRAPHNKIFALVDYLLGNAAVLKELTVRLPQPPAEKVLENVKRIFMFPRLSSACQVIII